MRHDSHFWQVPPLLAPRWWAEGRQRARGGRGARGWPGAWSPSHGTFTTELNGAPRERLRMRIRPATWEAVGQGDGLDALRPPCPPPSITLSLSLPPRADPCWTQLCTLVSLSSRGPRGQVGFSSSCHCNPGANKTAWCEPRKSRGLECGGGQSSLTFPPTPSTGAGAPKPRSCAVLLTPLSAPGNSPLPVPHPPRLPAVLLRGPAGGAQPP